MMEVFIDSVDNIVISIESDGRIMIAEYEDMGKSFGDYKLCILLEDNQIGVVIRALQEIQDERKGG